MSSRCGQLVSYGAPTPTPRRSPKVSGPHTRPRACSRSCPPSSRASDIEGFSHLYVLWVFDRAAGYELLGTPPIDTRAHGVFATRSPCRPNPIGLTVVRLLRREGSRLLVRGVDMLDGTPILDIKPYLSSVPPQELRRGWLAEAERASQGRGAR